MTPSILDILSNGRFCCALDLPCCIPPTAEKRQFSMAEILYAFSELPQVEEVPEWACTMAKNFLEHFDPVERGAAAHVVALAEMYQKHLAKRAKINADKVSRIERPILHDPNDGAAPVA